MRLRENIMLNTERSMCNLEALLQSARVPMVYITIWLWLDIHRWPLMVNQITLLFPANCNRKGNRFVATLLRELQLPFTS